MGDSKVKVAVRVRPLNRREIDLHTHCVVDMEDNQAVLYPPCARTTGQDGDSNFHQSLKKHPKTFAFDYCFWSIHETQKEKYSGQQQVFECMGKDILENAFQGYNACIFAYGQTGSGKSYTMMGSNEQPGLIPRLCSELFTRVAKEQCEELMVKVEVSYMEIYNERVRDLLDPKSGRTLRVREHKILGPYVDELSQLAVASYQVPFFPLLLLFQLVSFHSVPLCKYNGKFSHTCPVYYPNYYVEQSTRLMGNRVPSVQHVLQQISLFGRCIGSKPLPRSLPKIKTTRVTHMK
uniref:kinesin-like protein KIF13A n=1 Tax=Myxine glutinosa TaxID=7769 RepID=UPI00358E141F